MVLQTHSMNVLNNKLHYHIILNKTNKQTIKLDLSLCNINCWFIDKEFKRYNTPSHSF